MSNCENCEEEHNGEYGSGRFCSSKCARGFSTKEKRKEINEKVSKSLIGRQSPFKGTGKSRTLYEREDNCLKCDAIFRTRSIDQKYCSRKCSRSHCTDETKNKISIKVQERIKNGTHYGWQSRKTTSYPEKFFKKVLELNGYSNEFEINYKIKKRDLGLDCNANYFLDFYFPKYNVDLEIDGKQHEYKERKKKDAERDEALIKNEYNVYRIKWKSINNEKGKEYMKNEINKFFKYLENMI